MYLAGQWPRLIRFIENGRLEIDNNGAEYTFSPFGLPRKNGLLSHSFQGAKSSASLYYLIEPATSSGLKPYAFLCHVFKHIQAARVDVDFDVLLSWNVTRTCPRMASPQGGGVF
ncbi:MAG: transposase [Magnetococcales bacterium]|nr:transposase [Magnetococcales bacterium]